MKEKILGFLSPNAYLELKKQRNKAKVQEFREKINLNKRFYNIHKGKRCFIVANGPSTREVDFSSLSNEITFTVNQMARNPEFTKLNANYHLWADRVFFEIDDNKPEDLEMLDVIKSVNRISPSTEVFYESMARTMIDKYKLKETTHVNYFQVLDLDPRHMERSFIDFTNPVPNYPTVVDYAILLAVYMGFSRIYLLGCDCSGIVNIAMNKMKQAQESLYSFEMTENAAKRLEHYAQQRSMFDELTSQAAMFKSYEALDEYCKQNGAKLMNATHGSLLDCLERVKLENIL